MEGPFTNGRFSDFTSDYPLLLLGEAEREGKTSSETDQRAMRKDLPTKKKSARGVGSIKLRIGITASTSTVARSIRGGGQDKVADNANDAVGDGDAVEIRRRRTNKVTRRLRLCVGWVSLARLLSPIPGSFDATTTGKGTLERSAAEDKFASEQPGDSRKSQPWRLRKSHTQHVADSNDQAKRPSTEKGNCKKPTNSTTAGGGCPSAVPMPTSGVSCRITWFGETVAFLELCPETGLPLTPGECLLELPRGTAWRSCRLVLEVLATDEFMKHPRGQKALEVWSHLHRHHGPIDDGGNARAGDGRWETDIAGNFHVLGKIVVGWQVRGDDDAET